MEENNKNQAKNPPPKEETVVFRRAPDVSRNPDGTPSVNSRPQAKPSAPDAMQHTAKIQGGAVIRPLKSAQNPAPKQNRPQSGQAQPQARPAAKPAQPLMQNRAGQMPAAQRPANAPKPQNPPAHASKANPSPAQSAPAKVTPAQNPRPANLPASQHRTQPTPRIDTARQSQAVVPSPQPKRTENDDFEIDEATYLHGSRRKKREEQYSYAADSATSAIMSLVKAVVYIVVLIGISIVMSVFVIRTANDIFKFVGDEKLVTVEIPENATIEDIGTILGEAEIIKYPWAFNFWSNLKEDPEKPPNFIAGTYEVSTMLNYDYLRSTFKKKSIRSEVRITIPEGFTVDEIIDLFVNEYNIGTREGFIDAINNHDFDYRFLEGLTVSPDRLYRLEGYLFPDTYYFYSDSSEVAVLNKLLDNFDKKFASEYYDRCTDLGMTVDEVIILASMVEKEARYADEMGNISSVFHNRLKYKATFPWLQSDATIMYAIQHDTGSRLETMTGKDTEYETPYNTYKYKGLPPGPIANPGLNAIVYALYPAETEYFYFVANSSGRSLFAKTGPEHEKNIIIARQN